MSTELKLLKYSHCVGEANYHLQFTSKYRKPIFEDEVVRTECEHSFKQLAINLRVQLIGLGFGPDHVHLFLGSCKNYGAAELAQRLKGASSKAIRKKYEARLAVKGLYGKALWSAGYFHRTVGAVNYETMKRYVTESQGKHWKAEKPKSAQTTLLQFN